jgi:hypothetical protein
MGMSGMKGKVYYIDDSCSPSTTCEYGGVPSGVATCLTDEVTRFTIVDSVMKREYGHDKSGGWQDVVAGTRRLGITLDAVIASANVNGVGGDSMIWAGKVLWLELFPVGVLCDDPARGYAMVDQVSYTYDEETGKPNGYTATLSSKLAWENVGGMNAGQAWGGFECACAT